MPIRITIVDIREAVGETYFARGKVYFNQSKVESLEILEDSPKHVAFESRVRGSYGQAYTQDVDIYQERHYITIGGECTCPMDYNCKHVAAACLAYQDGASARRAAPTVQRDAASIVAWLNEVADLGMEAVPGADEDRLIYLLTPPVNRYPGRRMHAQPKAPVDARTGAQVELRMSRPRKNGRGLTKGRQFMLESLFYHSANDGYLRDSDREIGPLLKGLQGGIYFDYSDALLLKGSAGYLALMNMAVTGRCHWESADSPPLSPGDPRELHIGWREEKNHGLRLEVATEPPARLLPTDPPMYLDPQLNVVGHVETPGLNGAQLTSLMDAPIVSSAQAEQISRVMLRDFPQLPLPPPKAIATRENQGARPIPCLRLTGREALGGQYIHVAALDFLYAEDRSPALPVAAHSLLEVKAELVQVERDLEREGDAVQTLFFAGFAPIDEAEMTIPGPLVCYMQATNLLLSASQWSDFLDSRVPELEANGWRIETDDDFRLRFDEGEWSATVDEPEAGGNDWFGLRFDLEVDGHRLPLLPLIAPLLELDTDQALPEKLSVPLDSGEDAPSHRYVNLPSERLRPFLDTLREIYDRVPPGADGDLRLSRFDAGALNELEAVGTRLHGGDQLRELAGRLADFEGIAPVDPPQGLNAELRHYQRQGLNWLQFLREYRFGGILADDMGLGKTVQALAHLLVEKEAGRLDKPALIVAPTSLMGNWRREAQQFTPELRVLVLHGPRRGEHFDVIGEHDLVITTYPLLPRDQEILAQQEFRFLVLDEAQNIKNPKSKAAAVVRGLRAEHRLCLTGTPMENHLGELWAQFDFLLPGFLADQTHFKRYWRTPIENHGDADRQARLARRVAPFMLRRRKQDVLEELPPKTEIIRSIPLHKDQAALYESIRLSMEKRVREAIAAQGLGRSHITILDALLKLRQTCCHPKLLSLTAAAKVKHSAKLDLLMDILPEQLEEGRRILLFSQFTTMLGLIEDELKRRGIDYAKLTGQTRKRDEAIERFCSGEVAVFLISLKAGGVGLNLTEADTVILYDPWWNPAVETQAADRAHRIGQDKPVFVYKLITEDTVEEKILSLQAKKQALADAVYREGAVRKQAGLSADDLQALFAPLEAEG